MSTPAITPATSTLTVASTSVTITDATIGAVIYYTTDGSTPTTASTKYSAVFQLNCPVNTTVTVKAYAPAISSTYTDSVVASATYTCPVQVQTIPMALPVITPATSTLTATSTSVSITDATVDAVIYYTTDGSTPTTASAKYAVPFTLNCPINTSVTVKAYAPAIDSTYTDSTVATAVYTCPVQIQSQPMATPAITPATSTLTSTSTSVTITDTTVGSVIYYTTDGSTPTTTSTKYSAVFQLNCPVNSTVTVKAYAPALDSTYTDSTVAVATYTCLKSMATPAISPSPSKLTTTSTSVSITDSTVGAVIYYTTDGSTPTTASAKYAAPFTLSCPINAIATVKAYAPAISPNYTDSSISVTTYTCQTQATTPVISPVSGNITAGSSVSITDSTVGAVIYYTTDGSTPTVNSLKYAGSITINASQTVKAIAVGSDATWFNSNIAVAIYTVVGSPTIQVGSVGVPVLLNTGSVLIPMTTTNCDHLGYTITPAFPVPTNIGGVLGSITSLPSNNCQAVFSPGSTMPAPTNAMYQYTITFTAYGTSGATASASTVISLTTPPIVMGSTDITLPAGSGSATKQFLGSNCGFTSYNGLTSGNLWTGTLNGDGIPANAINGIPTRFADCNHVSMDATYFGTSPGDYGYTYLYNPPPAGGISAQITITWVASSNSSSVVTAADGTVATLKSQSVVNYLNPDKSVAKTVTSAPGVITFGSQMFPAGDIHQLIACGSNGTNFCGLGKNQLTVFASNGIAIKSYAIPEDGRFAVANSDSGIYVFATATNHLYSLASGKVTLLDGFTSSQDVTAAAINGNELAAITSDGQLQRFNVDANHSIGTYQMPTEMNNIAYTRDGSILVGKLGSTTVISLDRSGEQHTLALTAPLKTIVQAEQDDPFVSTETGDVIKVDSLGNSTKMATAKPEDLNAGFRIMGRTLVLTHVDPVSNARQVQTLVTQQ
jgi:spore germination cell wall hydrolase CwlJ-like protein